MTSEATRILQAADLVGTWMRGSGPVPGEHGRSPRATAHAHLQATRLSTEAKFWPLHPPPLLRLALLHGDLQGKQCGPRTLRRASGTPAFPRENHRHPSLHSLLRPPRTMNCPQDV